MYWQASVAEWLQQLGLSQYENVMIESGYDAIDFITSVTEEELVEIGITKQGFLKLSIAWHLTSSVHSFLSGHLKRFKKGIEELSDMLLSEPPTPSPFSQPFTHNLQSSPSHSISNISSCSQTMEGSSTRNSVAIGDAETSEPPNSDVSPVKSDPAKVETGETSTASTDRRLRAGSSGPHIAAKPRRVSRQDNTAEEPPLSIASSQDSGIESSGSVPPKTAEKPRPKGSAPPPIPKRSLSTQLTSNSFFTKKEESPLLTSRYASMDQADGPLPEPPMAPPPLLTGKPASRRSSQHRVEAIEKERPSGPVPALPSNGNVYSTYCATHSPSGPYRQQIW